MVRPELEELYRELTDSRFTFIPRGEVHLREVYASVKNRHPALCDDGYLCSTNCKSGYNSPEWKHVVRTALNEMKKRGAPVGMGSARGQWAFGSSGNLPARTDSDSEAETAREGRILLRTHKLRERQPRLVLQKKQAILAETGRLACEACDFDFAAFYGGLGENFAECHHRIPLSESAESTVTCLGDLAIVCANCHRMLHRSDPMMRVADLRRIVRRCRVRLERKSR